MQTRELKAVHTRRTFAIARSSNDSFEHVVLEIEEDGFVGRDEAAPSGRYDQDAEGIADALSDVEVRCPWNIEGALRPRRPPARLRR